MLQNEFHNVERPYSYRSILLTWIELHKDNVISTQVHKSLLSDLWWQHHFAKPWMLTVG